MPADPNMRCVCGYRNFRENLVTTTEEISRWLQFGAGGFGSTPFGTYFGASVSGTWGEFSTSAKVTRRKVACESCQRLRSNTLLSGVGVFGSYVFGGSLFIYVTDVDLISCLQVRFTNAEFGTYTTGPTKFAGAPLPLVAPAPPVVAPTPPAGAKLAGVLRVELPEVDHDGDYLVSLVDVCAGTELPIALFSLESNVQIHLPAEADLNGLPRSLIDSNLTADLTPSQPGSGSISGIPFDRCTAVIEYDARFGTGPLAQGWAQTVGASGDYGLTAGGILDAATTTSSYWEQSAALATPTTSVHAYAKYRVGAASSGAGQGFEFRAEAAPGSSADYAGARVFQDTDTLYTRTLSGSAQNNVDTQVQGPWSEMYLGAKIGDLGFTALNELVGVDVGVDWGTRPGGPLSAELRGLFGDYAGSNLSAQLRNFVVSASGRFVRAMFRSYAPTSSVVLRLHFVSDLGVNNSARVKVRYGSLAAGTDPYALGAVSSDVTAYFNTKNVVVEVPVTLTNLPAKSPFWFSIERDWQHPDDTTAATIHLLSATVRTS
jgi:hypothetical protein